MSDETPQGLGENTPELPDTPHQPGTPTTSGAGSSWPTAPSSRRSGASEDGSDSIDLPRTAPAFRPSEPQSAEPEAKPDDPVVQTDGSTPKIDDPVAPESPKPEPLAQNDTPAQPETPVVTLPAGRPILRTRRWTPPQGPETPSSEAETPLQDDEPVPAQSEPAIPDVPETIAPVAQIPEPADNADPAPPVEPEATPVEPTFETTASKPAEEEIPETHVGDGGSGDDGGQVPPTPATPDEGEPKDKPDFTPEAATEVIAEGGVTEQDKPEKKKRKGLIWFILAALLIIIAIVLFVTSCLVRSVDPNPNGYPTDMENNIIVPEDPAIMDPEFQKAADAIGDVYQGGFVIDSVGLNVPLGEVNSVEGVLNPPGFDRAYVVRNMGVLPPDATEGTVYVVLHTIVGGRGPGNYLIDPPKQTTTLREGDLIKVGNLTYKFTGFRLIPRDQLSAHPDLWTSEPNRLIIITCMLHPDININTITDNMVIFGELVS